MTSLLPVPLSPTTSQESSTISEEDRGRITWYCTGGRTIAPSASPSMPPRKIQSQWSVPEENCQCPEKTYPPSTGRSTPIGAYGEASQVSGSSPQTSSCTRGSAMASSHG